MQSAKIMVPAMNIDDQVELFGGAQAEAPPEVFAGMMALAQQALEPSRYHLLASRLGVA